jgi:SAM-dependent methyltransferase
MKEADKLKMFSKLTFDDFRKLATSDELNKYEKIGFPDSYRRDKEEHIFRDILAKLELSDTIFAKTILDIGPGCSDLPMFIVDYCKKQNHKLLLADSKEMLDQLPAESFIEKFDGYFPEINDLVENYKGKVDYIICYSVFHYVFYQSSHEKFIDVALSLLKPGGKFLIADIPNVSKRKRFFSSEAGIAFHKRYTKTDTLPEVTHAIPEPEQIDDGVIFGIMQRYRNFGFETYLLSQSEMLPMNNRREDILICKH